VDSRDLLILGAVGAAAWFFFFRRQTAAQPVAAANPTGAAGMAPGAAAQTQTGSAFVRGISGNTNPLGGGAPAPAYATPFFGNRFQQAALLLTAKDNNPVPNPPTPPNAFFAPILGAGTIRPSGANTMGPEPLAVRPPGMTGFRFAS
jgi:hypothetical protein